MTIYYIKKLNLCQAGEYLLYLLVFFLPWQTRYIWHYGTLGAQKWVDFASKYGWSWEYGTFSLYGVEILLWVLVAIILIYRIFLNYSSNSNHPLTPFPNQVENRLLSKEGGHNSPPWIRRGWGWFDRRKSVYIYQYIIIVFILYLLLSVFWSLDKNLSAYYLLHLLEAVILIYLISKIKFSYKKIFYVFFASVFIQACFGIWQFVNQQVVANKWLGMASQNPSDVGVSVVFTGLRRWLRAYGAFSHPNILAGFLSLGFLVGLYLIINYYVENKKQLYFKITLIFGELIILLSLLLTFSRGAWISLGVVLIFFYFVIYSKNKDAGSSVSSGKPSFHSERLKNLKLIGIYCLLITVVVAFIFREPFLTRIKNDQRLETKSTSERIEYYKESWEIIKKRPLFGVGVGNYTLAVHDLVNQDKKQWEYQPVHNIFVLILVELGVVGFVLLFLIIFQIFKNRKKIINDTALISLCLLMFILLSGMFDHYWWTSYFGVTMFGLVFGLFKNKQI